MRDGGVVRERTGCSKGKGLDDTCSMPRKDSWAGHGIVGGHIPLGAGLAFASK